MKHEAEMRRLVHKHLVAMAEEAKRDLPLAGATPAGSSLVAMYEAIRQAAWSLGSTLRSNGEKLEPLRTEIIDEIAREIDHGYSCPGEGHLL